MIVPWPMAKMGARMSFEVVLELGERPVTVFVV